VRIAAARQSRAFFGAADGLASTPEKVQPSDSGRDEEETEQEADRAAAVQRRHDEQRDADRDEREAEDCRPGTEERVHTAHPAEESPILAASAEGAASPRRRAR
jgi:hypothetical protein